MADLQRPLKRGGNRKYAEEYAVGNHYAQDTEIDADFDTIYRAWNTEVPPTMRDTIVPPNSITNAMIQDGAVDDDKISDVAWTKITGAPTSIPPTGQAGGDLAGSTYPDPVVKPLAITKPKLAVDVAAGLAPAYTVADANKVLAVNTGGTALQFVAAPPATINPGQITTTYIADSPNGVTDAKITSVSWSKVTGAPTSFPPTGAAGGDLAGSTYPAPVIAPGKVTDAKINDVAATKLTGTIPVARLPVAPSGLGTTNINDGAINNAKISDVAWGKVTGAPTSFPPTGPAGGSLAGSSYPNPTLAIGSVGPLAIAQNATIVYANNTALVSGMGANTNPAQIGSITPTANGRYVRIEASGGLGVGVSALNTVVCFVIKRDGADLAFWFIPCGATTFVEFPLSLCISVWDTAKPGGSPTYTLWEWTNTTSANVHTATSNPGFMSASVWA